MKERIGFVSNSSSSSFIVVGKRIPGVNNQIIDWLEKATHSERQEQLDHNLRILDNPKYPPSPDYRKEIEEENRLLSDERLAVINLLIPYGAEDEGNLYDLLKSLNKVKGFVTLDENNEEYDWVPVARRLLNED